MDKDKQEIINRFYKNVKGKRSDTSNSNKRHDGAEGHWLEKQMGVTPNADNKPDLFGYEMKNQTTSGKTTYGDWMADEYIFIHGRPEKRHVTNNNYNLSKDDFLRIFGKANINKGGRLSWSGEPCPTYFEQCTNYGQKLDIDNNNVIITYNYSLDKRENKNKIVPLELQLNNLIIAKWSHASLKEKVENKFNQKGWFKCKKDTSGYYNNICFAPPINFNTWIDLYKKKLVFFDSAMNQGTSRNRSQWRSNNTFWDSLITDIY